MNDQEFLFGRKTKRIKPLNTYVSKNIYARSLNQHPPLTLRNKLIFCWQIVRERINQRGLQHSDYNLPDFG